MAKDLIRMPTLSEVDLSGLSEWEKSSISSVMEKAEEIQKREENNLLRQKMEGQLSKWTNLMKGWQYRWFVLNSETGHLEYYVDKSKWTHGSEPRGSVHLMGAVIAPSDEDSVTFSVNAANGDLFKLRASDARERQQWINKIRMISEMHSTQLVNKVQQSSQTIGQASAIPSSGKQPQGQNLVNALTTADNTDLSSSKERITTISSEVLEYMEVINELLNTTEAQQMAFINKIEEAPNDGETVNPLSKDVLITKATAQATLHCLYQCLAILQKQIDDTRDVARNSGIPEDASIQWFGPPDTKTVPHSQHPHLLHSHSIPSIPSSSGSVSGGKKTSLPCCIDNFVDGVELESHLHDEVDDESVNNQAFSLENENMEEHKSLILHLLSKLKLGMDLTKVPLPTFILEPRSSLEMFADFYGYPDLFLKISEEHSAEERMLAAVQYYLTSFYAARKGHYSKKPYNPVLGEIFQCSWNTCARQTHGDVSNTENTEESRDCRLRYVAEQVSHHPPVSAFYVECPQKNVCMNCHIWTKSKFYGMSIGVELIGDGVLTLLNHDEEYVFTFPNAYCRSILTRPWTELGGKVNISCSKTGYSSSITFHTKPMYGGVRDNITGEVKHLPSGRVVCRINGQWTEKIEMVFPDKGVQHLKVLEPKVMTKTCKKLRPLSLQQDNESRKLWNLVTEAVRNDDIDKAAEEKRKLEEDQRVAARQREESETPWKTKLFHQHGEKWLYNHHLSLRRKRLHSASRKRQDTKPTTT
ncbi:oxysterol-binding protein-related protein 11-like [Dendronephthya gigantea]|uniref:oxysterol-binding protein-related protein 11-like n=1 Tax=Dendronephthya gigantea TaxID=151771 RepID=UPI0010694EC1|nr:oxysterol-binding protein-related protein 11-like [Dendronephthya gigantea]